MKNTENRIIMTPYVFHRATFSSKVIIVLEGGSVIKNLPAKAGDTRDTFNPWFRKIPWRRK